MSEIVITAIKHDADGRIEIHQSDGSWTRFDVRSALDRYIDSGGLRAKDFRDVLRLMRDKNPEFKDTDVQVTFEKTDMREKLVGS